MAANGGSRSLTDTSAEGWVAVHADAGAYRDAAVQGNFRGTVSLRSLNGANVRIPRASRQGGAFPAGASAARRPLQPEAAEAGMEVTKCLKPSDSGHEFGDCASVQAATRVNAEANLT